MRSVFCGREPELAELCAAFRRVAGVAEAPGGPELVVVAAEAGLGKTRLVQEFYRRLVAEFDGPDGESYWPRSLAQTETNLLINPDPKRCSAGRPLPFLWWGIRLEDPGEKNAIVSGSLRAHLDCLSPHLEPMAHAKRREQRRKDAVKTGGGLALDIGLDMVPGAGLLKTAGEAAYDFWLLRKAAGEDAAPRSLAEVEEAERTSLIDGILDDLDRVFASGEGRGSVPAVILFDDAQFSSADPAAAEFFAQLLDRALDRRWPLLILVTHWLREWHQAEPGTVPSIAAAVQDRKERLPAAWQPLALQPVSDLAPMVQKSLPGLTVEQREALIERSGGNPRYLEQMILLARTRPRYFHARDTMNAMTAQGFELFQAESVDLHRTVEQRLGNAGEGVKSAVALSSVQGMRFSPSLTREMADALDVEIFKSDLDAAERPYGLVSGMETGIGEFAQRIFQEVAASLLPDIAGEQQVAAALMRLLRRRLDEPATEWAVSDREAEQTYRLAAELFEHAEAESDRLRALQALLVFIQVEMADLDYHGALAQAERIRQGIEEERWGLDNIEPEGLGALSDVFRVMGRYDEAVLFARTHVREACALAARQGDAESRRAASSAILSLAELSAAQGDLAAAETLYEQGLVLAQRVADQLGSAEARRDLWFYCQRLAELKNTQGELNTAAALYGRGLEIAISLDRQFGTAGAKSDLAVSQLHLADIKRIKGDLDGAGRLYAEGLDTLRSLAEELPTPAARRKLLVGEMRLAEIKWLAGDIDGAERLYGSALQAAAELDEQLATPLSQRDLLPGYYRLADIMRAKGDLKAASLRYRQGIRIAKPLAEELATAEARRDLYVGYNGLAEVNAASGDREAAQRLFIAGLRLAQSLAEELGTPQARRDLSVSYHRLADLLAGEGDLKRAGLLYGKSHRILVELAEELKTPEARRDVLVSLDGLGDLKLRSGDLDAATALFTHGLKRGAALLEEVDLPDAKRMLMAFHSRLGDIARIKGEAEAAATFYANALTLAEALVGALGTREVKRAVTVVNLNLATLKRQAGELDAAAVHCDKAEAVAKPLAEDSPEPQYRQDLAALYMERGEIQWGRDDLAAAFEDFVRGIELAELLARDLGTSEAYANLALFCQRIADVKRLTGDPEGARALYTEALQINKSLLDAADTPAAQRAVAAGHVALAQLSDERQDHDAAVKHWQDALARAETYHRQMATPDAETLLATVRDGLEKAESAAVASRAQHYAEPVSAPRRLHS